MPITEEMAKRKIREAASSLEKAIAEAEKLLKGEYPERIKGFILLLREAAASMKAVKGACSRSEMKTEANEVEKRFNESLDLLSVQITGVVQTLLFYLQILGHESSEPLGDELARRREETLARIDATLVDPAILKDPRMIQVTT